MSFNRPCLGIATAQVRDNSVENPTHSMHTSPNIPMLPMERRGGGLTVILQCMRAVCEASKAVQDGIRFLCPNLHVFRVLGCECRRGERLRRDRNVVTGFDVHTDSSGADPLLRMLEINGTFSPAGLILFNI